MSSNRNRIYIGENIDKKPLYLVYKHVNNKVSSQGPFYVISEADDLMRSHLINGICAWMVLYNENKR